MDKMQEIIDEYLSVNDHQPLVFEDYDPPSPKTFSLEEYALKELLVKCVNTSAKFRSVTLDGKLQCKNGYSRSSLDLWRHLLYYNPELTYREVLAVLSESQDIFYICSCPDIHRRVFYIPSGIGPQVCRLHTEPDEFGLQFEDWKGFKE